MILNKLLTGIDGVAVYGSQDIWVDNVTHLADNVDNRYMYIALHTEHTLSIEQAINNGASVVVSEQKLHLPKSITQVVVREIRSAYALIAKNYYHADCEKLRLVAVVGTNGKSTTTHIISKLLLVCGVSAGFIGTGYYTIADRVYKNNFTTPDPMSLHAILSSMAQSGVKVVVMEVSAHAIYLKKVFGLHYDIGVFTNLSQDHLDYFRDMEHIGSVKQSFFLDGYADTNIVNIDDTCGLDLAQKLNGNCLTYSLKDKKADICAENIRYVSHSMVFDMAYNGNSYPISSNFVGDFNVYNILAAIMAVHHLGVCIGKIVQAMPSIPVINGRANVLCHNDINYIVDYAHTPVGLENILSAARAMTKGKLIVLFGAGGDRDKDKRSKMGKVADTLADIIILTSDNPRGEDRQEIMQDIARGMSIHTSKMIADRASAVAYACSIAKSGDSIVVAGKGGEEYIEEKGRKYKYNDKDRLEEILGIKWQ